MLLYSEWNPQKSPAVGRIHLPGQWQHSQLQRVTWNVRSRKSLISSHFINFLCSVSRWIRVRVKAWASPFRPPSGFETCTFLALFKPESLLLQTQRLTEAVGGFSWEAKGQMVPVAGSRGIGTTLDCIYAAKIDKLWVSTRESTDRRTQCESCGQRFHLTRMDAGVQTEADGNYSFSLVHTPGPDYFLKFHQNFNHAVCNWLRQRQPLFRFNTNNKSKRKRDNETEWVWYIWSAVKFHWQLSQPKGCTRKL